MCFHAFCLQYEHHVKRQDAEDFLTLHETEWADRIAAIANQSIKESLVMYIFVLLN